MTTRLPYGKLSEAALDIYRPELRLWAAVIRHAVREARGQFSVTSECLSRQTIKNYTADAKRWLLSDDERRPSFRWVCRHLGIDPDDARKMAYACVRDKSNRLVSLHEMWDGIVHPSLSDEDRGQYLSREDIRKGMDPRGEPTKPYGHAYTPDNKKAVRRAGAARDKASAV